MKTFQIKTTIISVFFIFYSCKSFQSIVNETDVYEVVYKNQFGGKKDKSNVIIQNYEEFNLLITELKIDSDYYERLLEIDLEKNNLLACFLGEKLTDGYNLEIEKVVFKENISEVFVKQIVPEKNKLVTSEITSPYLFVILPKNKSIIVKYTD